MHRAAWSPNSARCTGSRRRRECGGDFRNEPGGAADRARWRLVVSKEKAADPAAFRNGQGLLAEMSTTVFATEYGSGLADEAVSDRIAVVVTAVVAVIVAVIVSI